MRAVCGTVFGVRCSGGLGVGFRCLVFELRCGVLLEWSKQLVLLARGFRFRVLSCFLFSRRYEW
jgi:hypothetical protein